MTPARQWYPHHIEKYRRKTAHLTIAEHGAYRLLMDAYWDRRGPLPADETRLRKLIGADADEWAVVREAVLAFFTLTDEGWRHDKVEEQIAEAEAKYNAKVERMAAARSKIKTDISSDISADHSDTITTTTTVSKDTLPRSRAQDLKKSRKRACPKSRSAEVPPHPDESCAEAWEKMRERIGDPSISAWFMTRDGPVLRKNCAGFVIAASGVRADRIGQQFGPALNDVFGAKGWRIEPPDKPVPC